MGDTSGAGLDQVNGKVDRRLLPSLEDARPALEASYVGPRTELEQSIAKTWEEILGIKPIGIHDEFFDLGGHSLVAMSILTRLGDRYHLTLPLRVIFEAPTVADLANYVDVLLWATNAPNDQADDPFLKRVEIEL